VEGNPLALGFLLLALLLMGLTILFVVLQKRMLRDQSKQVQELLEEMREMARGDADDESSS
jgi:preprotein translocase subunit YajC